MNELRREFLETMDETSVFLTLIKSLINKYGQEQVWQYLTGQTGIVRNVIDNWVNNIATPNSGIRKQLIGMLKAARESDFPQGEVGRAINSISGDGHASPDKAAIPNPRNAEKSGQDTLKSPEKPQSSNQIEKIYAGLDPQEVRAYLTIKEWARQTFNGQWFQLKDCPSELRSFVLRLRKAGYLEYRKKYKTGTGEYQVKDL